MNGRSGPHSRDRRRRWPRRWRLLLWLGLLLPALYLAMGYGVLPAVLHWQLPKQLSSALQRPVSLREVDVDPLEFSIAIEGLQLSEGDGGRMLELQRVAVDLAPWALLRGEWAVDDVALSGLRLALDIDADGSSNLQRWLDSLSAQPEASSADAPTPRSPRWRVDRLQLDDAWLDVVDRGRSPPFAGRIGPLHLAAHTLGSAQQTGTLELRLGLDADGALSSHARIVALQPVHIEGRLQAQGGWLDLLQRYLGDALGVRVSAGHASLDLAYDLRLSAEDALALVVDELRLSVDGLALQQPGQPQPMVAMQQLRVQQGTLRWPQAQLAVGAIELRGLQAAIERSAQDEWSLRGWTLPADAAEVDPAPAADAPPWSFSVARLALVDAQLDVVDRSVGDAVQLQLRELALELGQLDSAADAPTPLQVQAQLASGGRLALDGALTWLPTPHGTMDFALQDVNMAVLQGYLSDVARIRLAAGTLHTQGVLQLTADDDVVAEGQLRVQDLQLRDAAQDRALLGWQSMEVDHWQFALNDYALTLSEVTLLAPRAQLRIEPDLSSNLDALLVEADAAATDESPALALDIGRIRLTDGELEFSDRSLPLPFAVRLAELEGELGRLSSSSRQAAPLRLSGVVGDYGAARVSGELLPFAPSDHTRLQLLFRNIRLPEFSAYTVKFAGRSVTDGVLDLQLDYDISEAAMQGRNSMVLSRLRLGEKLDQPGALDLPLDLAIALLADRHGNIGLDIPVQGNVDDPQFALGPLIRSALSQALGTLVSAPFRALGRLLGLGESQQLGELWFEPGRAALPPPTQESLVQLAQALRERPELVLELPALVLDPADREALQRQQVDAAIERGVEALRKDSPEVLRRDPLRRQVIETAYRQLPTAAALDQLQAVYTRPPADQPLAAPELDETAYVAALRDALVAAAVVDAAALQALADARRSAVLERLQHGSSANAAPVWRASDRPSAELDGRGWIRVPLGLARGNGG